MLTSHLDEGAGTLWTTSYFQCSKRGGGGGWAYYYNNTSFQLIECWRNFSTFYCQLLRLWSGTGVHHKEFIILGNNININLAYVTWPAAMVWLVRPQTSFFEEELNGITWILTGRYDIASFTILLQVGTSKLRRGLFRTLSLQGSKVQ